MLSDHETSGGAAVAAARLAIALVGQGVELTRLVAFPDPGGGAGTGGEIVSLGSVAGDPGLVRLARQISPSGSRSLHRGMVGRRLRAALRRIQPDVINVHNLHDANWAPDLLGICAEIAPTVWTLHDMWSFTGRCTYSYDCTKYLEGCDAHCPTAGEYPAVRPDLIAGEWSRRKRLLDGHPDLVAVSPSRWLAERAAAGLWKEHRIERIPYGLPLDVFRPLDRVAARAELGIEGSGPVLLFAAERLDERRKGGLLLAQALRQLGNREVQLVTFGRGEMGIDGLGGEVRSLGFLCEDREKVLAFNAADLLVHPAPVDNHPNVVMEAISCGTPCVALPIGGLPDMVVRGVSGWLASEPTAPALAAALGEACESVARGESFRDRCREFACAHWSDAQQAGRYLTLFESLLGSTPRVAVTHG
jgi:glycosyltransferase involved in cell wall biosynthesis